MIPVFFVNLGWFNFVLALVLAVLILRALLALVNIVMRAIEVGVGFGKGIIAVIVELLGF